jgi:hypothetical protein
VVGLRHLEGFHVGLGGRTSLLFETGKVFVEGVWMTKVAANASSLRGTSATTSGEVSVAELVVLRCYQAA